MAMMFRPMVLLALFASMVNARSEPGRTPGPRPPPTIGPFTGPVRKCLLDIAILIDASGSLWADLDDKVQGQKNWEAIQKFTGDLVRDFIMNGNQDTHIAAVKFEDKGDTMMIFNLDELGRTEMENKLRTLPYDLRGGRTRLDVALEILQTEIFVSSNAGDRPEAPNVAIVLTDGNVTKQYEDRAFQLIQQLKDAGTLFMAIGVGNLVNEAQLNRIASNGFYFTVDQFAQLESILMEIQNQACIIILPPTTTTTAGPPSTCPQPDPYKVAFSAYTGNHDMMLFTLGMVLPFSATILNIGGHFNTATYQFTCPCEGVYEFHLTMSYLTAGVAAGIVQNGKVISPVAYNGNYPGAMSTTAIIKCYPGDKVYAQILLPSIGLMPCWFEGNSFYGFTGKLLFA